MKKPLLKSQLKALVVAEFMVILATSLSLPFWPVILKQYTHNPHSLHFWSMLVYALPLGATMLTAPFWGSFADRLGYKKMVLRASLGLCVTQALLCFATSPIWICACVLLQGVFCGFIASAQALGVRLSGSGKSTKVLGSLQSAVALGTLIGPLVGAMVLNRLPFQVIFALSALMCLLASLLIVFKTTEPVREGLKKGEASYQRSEQFSLYTKLCFVSVFVSQLARYMIMPVFALFVLHQLHGSLQSVGVLFAASGLGVFVFSPLVSRHKPTFFKRETCVVGALVMAAVLQLLLALSGKVWEASILRFLWGFSLAVILPFLYALAVDVSASSRHGRVIGFANAACKLGNLIGILAGGLLIQFVSLKMLFVLIAFVYLANALFTLLLQPVSKLMHLNQQRSPHEQSLESR